MFDKKEPIFSYLPKSREWQVIYVPLTKQRQRELEAVSQKPTKKFIKPWTKKKKFHYKYDRIK